MSNNLRTYRIEFHDADYDCAMDSKSFGADEKIIRAVSAQDALTIFKTNNPRVQTQIKRIEDITES